MVHGLDTKIPKLSRMSDSFFNSYINSMYGGGTSGGTEVQGTGGNKVQATGTRERGPCKS